MTTLTLQPDATAGKDAYIETDWPTWNQGVHAEMFTGQNFGATYRQFIQFDLLSLPTAAIISSATLSLYMKAEYSNNARTCRIFRMKQAWLEGTGLNSSPGDGITWNTYDGSNVWVVAGGFDPADCEQTDIGNRDFSATETINEFKDFSLTPTTKAGLDLGNGWMIKMDTESGDIYSFWASDYTTDPAKRPKLVIVYTVPPRIINLGEANVDSWTRGVKIYA